jgi:hypothetical protein
METIEKQQRNGVFCVVRVEMWYPGKLVESRQLKQWVIIRIRYQETTSEDIEDYVCCSYSGVQSV